MGMDHHWGCVVRQLLTCFVRGEKGATAIEYALIAGAIAMVIVAAVNSVGTSLGPIFTNVAANLH